MRAEDGRVGRAFKPPAPVDVDGAVTLAREWVDLDPAKLVGAFSGDAWTLARAVIALHEQLAEADGWTRDFQKAIEQRTAEQIAAWLRKSGYAVPYPNLIGNAANDVLAGAWKPAPTERALPGRDE